MRLLMLLWIAMGLALAVPVAFTYAPPQGHPAIAAKRGLEVRSVSLRGSFHNQEEAPVKPGSGVGKIVLELAGGTYTYKGGWPNDRGTSGEPDPQASNPPPTGPIPVVGPTRPQPSGDLNFEHDPKLPKFVSLAADGLSVRFQAGEGSVKWAIVQAEGRNHPMHRQLWQDGSEIWRVALPPSIKNYRIRLETAQNKPAVFGPFDANHPLVGLDWVGKSIGYQVFPERFWNGDKTNDMRALETDEYRFNETWNRNPQATKPYLSNWNDPPGELHCCHQYFGGDLAGFLEKLPHLEALGVGLVYFNPLFDSGSAHGYDTHDYYKISPKFGDEALLRQVLDAAHAQGMRVIFDFVPNHTGLGFFAFQDVVKNGRASQYWNWYTIRQWPFRPGDPSAYDTFSGVGSLPKLNTANPEVKKYLLEVAEHWMRFGFDGLRVDYPQGIVNREDFYRDLRRVVKGVKPDAYIVAEIWARDPSWLQGDQADSLMNYAIGRDIVLRFARGGGVALYSGRRALADLVRIYTDYPEAVVGQGWNLIGSHDTPRVLTDLGGGALGDTPSPESLARLRLAMGLLYALPGMPIFFQGDECGFTGEAGQYPVNELYRYPIQWDRCNPDVLEFYQRLGKVRAGLAALQGPAFRAYAGEGAVLAFLRGEPGQEVVLAAFNKGSEPANLALPGGTWRDALSGQTFQSQAELPAIGFRYLVRAGQ